MPLIFPDISLLSSSTSKIYFWIENQRCVFEEMLKVPRANKFPFSQKKTIDIYMDRCPFLHGRIHFAVCWNVKAVPQIDFSLQYKSPISNMILKMFLGFRLGVQKVTKKYICSLVQKSSIFYNNNSFCNKSGHVSRQFKVSLDRCLGKEKKRKDKEEAMTLDKVQRHSSTNVPLLTTEF